MGNEQFNQLKRGEDSSPHAVVAIPRDPASGKYIVADILHPNKPHIQLAAISKSSNTSPSIKISSAPSKKSPVKNIEKNLTQNNTPLAKAKKDSLDEWFQKRKNSFDIENTVKHSTPKKRAYSHVRLFGVLILLIILSVGGMYGFGRVFAKVNISLDLKSEIHAVDTEIIIASDGRTGSILGELLTITQSGEDKFLATGSDTVEAKAKGTITIYNAFNSNSQTLVANTRFEAPDGKIYRIQKAVTIPGATLKDGKIIPSSIDAQVFASESGEEYNKESAEFTIPGFKGSDRFSGFYARTKTPLVGGFVGQTSIVTAKDRDNAEEILKNKTRTQTKQGLYDEVPAHFMLLDDAFEILTNSSTFSVDTGDVAVDFIGSVTMEGRAIIFRSTDLGTYLANSLGLPTDKVYLANPGDISISIIRRSFDAGTLVLHVSGPVQFLWNFSEQDLINELLSTSSSEAFNDIFSTYPAIERAEVRFSPTWIRSVPKESKDVVISKKIIHINP